MYGQMSPIDVWFNALLWGEMERLIWEWKTAWGEVGKHSGLDRKILLFSLSTSLSWARLLFPWQRSWLHENCCGCGCHGNTLHYIILVLRARMHLGVAYTWTWQDDALHSMTSQYFSQSLFCLIFLFIIWASLYYVYAILFLLLDWEIHSRSQNQNQVYY